MESNELTTENSGAMMGTGGAASTEMVLTWLDNALAMENALAAVLQHRIKDATDFPAVEKIDRDLPTFIRERQKDFPRMSRTVVDEDQYDIPTFLRKRVD